jgi:hypothetical protein
MPTYITPTLAPSAVATAAFTTRALTKAPTQRPSSQRPSRVPSTRPSRLPTAAPTNETRGICPAGYFGIEGEACTRCYGDTLHSSLNLTAVEDRGREFFPQGFVCTSDFMVSPSSAEGWFVTQEVVPSPHCSLASQKVRSECPAAWPCYPAESCLGANSCDVGYDGERCAICVTGGLRSSGRCVSCGTVYIALALLALFAVTYAVYMLLHGSTEASCRCFVSVDLLQMLGILATVAVPHVPAFLQTLMDILTVFNFNPALLLTHCGVDHITSSLSADTFTHVFAAVNALPVLAALVLLPLRFMPFIQAKALAACLRPSAEAVTYDAPVQRILERHGVLDATSRDAAAAPPVSTAALRGMYEANLRTYMLSLSAALSVLYTLLLITSLSVFDCRTTSPYDGSSFLAALGPVPGAQCHVHGSVQHTLVPWAIAVGSLYAVGIPFLLLTTQRVVRDDTETSVAHKATAFSPRQSLLQYFQRPPADNTTARTEAQHQARVENAATVAVLKWMTFATARRAMLVAVAAFVARSPSALVTAIALASVAVAVLTSNFYSSSGFLLHLWTYDNDDKSLSGRWELRWLARLQPWLRPHSKRAVAVLLVASVALLLGSQAVLLGLLHVDNKYAEGSIAVVTCIVVALALGYALFLGAADGVAVVRVEGANSPQPGETPTTPGNGSAHQDLSARGLKGLSARSSLRVSVAALQAHFAVKEPRLATTANQSDPHYDGIYRHRAQPDPKRASDSTHPDTGARQQNPLRQPYRANAPSQDHVMTFDNPLRGWNSERSQSLPAAVSPPVIPPAPCRNSEGAANTEVGSWLLRVQWPFGRKSAPLDLQPMAAQDAAAINTAQLRQQRRRAEELRRQEEHQRLTMHITRFQETAPTFLAATKNVEDRSRVDQSRQDKTTSAGFKTPPPPPPTASPREHRNGKRRSKSDGKEHREPLPQRNRTGKSKRPHHGVPPPNGIQEGTRQCAPVQSPATPPHSEADAEFDFDELDCEDGDLFDTDELAAGTDLSRLGLSPAALALAEADDRRRRATYRTSKRLHSLRQTFYRRSLVQVEPKVFVEYVQVEVPDCRAGRDPAQGRVQQSVVSGSQGAQEFGRAAASMEETDSQHTRRFGLL